MVSVYNVTLVNLNNNVYFTLFIRKFWYKFVISDDYGRGMRMDLARGDGNKRRAPRNEPEQTAKETPPPATQAPTTAPPRPEAEVDDKPIPDDLSEISDDPDDILNREDVSQFILIICNFKPFLFANDCH